MSLSIARFVLIFIFLRCFQLISCEFEILILHTNDMHSRFDETNINSDLITNPKSNESRFGGFARLKTAINEAKELAKTRNVPSLFLNAGDTFYGTVFYTLLKDRIVSDLLPLLGIDVMCLGNHEFDDGTKVLARYLEKVQIPVVAANLDFKREPLLQNSNFLNKSQVKEINGRKIGIIGYLTNETQKISSPRKTIFYDEIESIKAEAIKLKNDGVNIIIALGHSGIEIDKKIAKEVPDVSLVIGGHTNTFLYNPPSEQPSNDKPEGPYPLIVEQASGKKVPVVSAYAFTKYLGKLWATFDDNGNFVSARPESNPMLIDSKIKEDEPVKERVSTWRNKINAKLLEIVGKTNVYLDGWRAYCKILECNLGNLVTDSFIDYVAEKYNNSNGWTDAPIAMVTSGSIKLRENPNKIHGNMSYNEVATFLKHKSSLCKAVINGSTLRAALEHSVARYTPKYDKEVPNEFLQVSGIHIIYDVSKPPHKRILEVEVRCGNCTVPKYAPLNDTENYGIILPRFLVDGGDGYKMLEETLYTEDISGEVVDDFSSDPASDTDLLARFIRKYKVVYPEVSGRITVLNANSTTSNANSITSNAYKSSSVSLYKISLHYFTIFTFIFVFTFEHL